MNDEIGLLLVIAPIAVAFAGFGSIATAFAARRTTGETQVASTRLVNMLLTSLQVAFLALLPAALSLFAIPERWLWGSSAAACLLATAIIAPPAYMRSFRITRAAGFSWPPWAVGVVLTVGGVAGPALVLFDIPADNTGATYAAGLMCTLAISALQFFQVVHSILRPHAPETPSAAPQGEPPTA